MGNGGHGDSITADRTSSTLNSSVARTFRPHLKASNSSYRISSTNTLNHVAFTNWNNFVNSTQFGLPVSPGAMRSLQTTFHLRF